MRGWIASLNIRVKLLVAFSSVILLSAVLIFFTLRAINKITDHKTTNEKLETLELDFTLQELAIKEFIYEGYKQPDFQEKMQSPVIDKFKNSQHRSQQVLKYLQENSEEEYQVHWKKLQELDASIGNELDSLKRVLKTRGFKDFGLEGSLRKAVHDVENSKATFSKEMLLTLRRNEKDFFLRKDLKYQQDFNKNIEAFKATLRSNESETLELIDQYEKQMNAIVEIETEIGLTEKTGIRGRLKRNFAESIPLLSKIKAEVMEQNQKEITQSRVTLVFIFVAQLILGLLLAIFYSDVITKSVRAIRDAMQALANGAFPEKMKVTSTEELGQTKAAVNHLVDRIESAVVFSQKLGNGELNATYDQRFQKDVLAQAIIQMQSKLIEADERQSKINWTNEGIAQIAGITKNEHRDISELGNTLLSTLVKYVGANQAALYTLQNDELHRIATYAYGKKKFLEEKIGLGNGLVGQCAVEGETIFLTDIPRDYTKITSGLGEATPRNVLIVPLKVKDDTFGVLELASFEKLPSYKVAYVEKIGENIALLISNRTSTDQMKELLQQSQEKAEMLTQQEEEMRQNSEELQATQEEMIRQRNEMEKEIVTLRQQLQEKSIF